MTRSGDGIVADGDLLAHVRAARERGDIGAAPSAAELSEAERDTVIAALPRLLPDGTLQPPTRLRATDALKLVCAFLSGAAQTVQLEGSDVVVTFLGVESILILGGTTGLGKSVAGAWAIR